MKDLIELFIESMKADGKSKCTIQAYRLDMKNFSEFFDNIDISNIRYAELKRWSNYLEKNGLSESSRARKIATIKSFFKYLVKMEIIDRNPADIIESPKQEKKQPIVISVEDANKLLFYARNDCRSEIFWFRDYTIIAMFLFTGIRREELTNILIEDVDLKKDTILIHGKGKKQRIVYINNILHSVLSEYILCYRKLLKKANESKYLFLSSKNDKMSVNTINNIVNKIFKNSGIKKRGVSVHVLRKRFATTIFENTGDIALTSKLLGHSSPNVTMRYIIMDENIMRNAINCLEF